MGLGWLFVEQLVGFDLWVISPCVCSYVITTLWFICTFNVICNKSFNIFIFFISRTFEFLHDFRMSLYIKELDSEVHKDSVTCSDQIWGHCLLKMIEPSGPYSFLMFQFIQIFFNNFQQCFNLSKWSLHFFFVHVYLKYCFLNITLSAISKVCFQIFHNWSIFGICLNSYLVWY